jgi:hypothetical protein
MNPVGAGRTARWQPLLTHTFYLAVSLVFATRFFSLAHPGSHVMLEGDPALMCWTLQWVSHALLRDPLHLYAGNVFYPYSHAVVLTDPMVSLAVLNLPVRLVTANPWVGYNLLILAAYYLSCVSGAALARALTHSEHAAIWGGLFWGFLFFRVHHIGHLQILSFQLIPAAVLCLVRFWQRPDGKTLSLLVLVVAAQVLVSWYLAVILAAVLIVVAAGQQWATLRRPGLWRYALAAGLLAMLILPFAWPYRAGFEDSSLAERRALVTTMGDAVHLWDYLTPPAATLPGRLVPGNPYSIWGENTLYIGMTPLVLAVAGLFLACRRPDRSQRRWAVIGVVLVAAGYVLALGFVSPSLGVRLPLHYLARAFPMLAGMRATQRFSLVLYVGILILSSLGMTQTFNRLGARGRTVLLTLAGAAFLLEVYPAELPFTTKRVYAVSNPDRFIAQYQRTRPDSVRVLHLPIYYLVEPYPVEEATYMVDSTWHWARLLNGFSGAVPNGFMDRMQTLGALPEPKAVRLLLELGVDIVAVHGAAGSRRILFDFFSQRPWAGVVPLPDGEFVVVIDHERARSAVAGY